MPPLHQMSEFLVYFGEVFVRFIEVCQSYLNIRMFGPNISIHMKTTKKLFDFLFMKRFIRLQVCIEIELMLKKTSL